MIDWFLSRINGWPLSSSTVAAGGLSSAVGAACFVVNIWPTMDASAMRTINSRGRAVPVLPQADAH